METMKFYTMEEVLDHHFGAKGTPRRDNFERSVDEAVNTWRIGEQVRAARKEQGLTQAQLGSIAGVSPVIVSRVERGGNATLATLSRIFRGVGIKARLDMGSLGAYSLC